MSNLQKKLFRKRFGLGNLQLVSEESSFQDSSDDIEETTDSSESSHLNGFYSNEFENIRSKAFPIIKDFERDGFSLKTYYSPPSKGENENTILLCNHGAGSSAMTFCALALYLKEAYNESVPGILAYDMRGHGLSGDAKSMDYSLDTLTMDLEFILDNFCKSLKPGSRFCLVGHSLGGAIMINFLCRNTSLSFDIRGLVVVDIVEETAVRALASMSDFLWTRPRFFRSYEEAVSWHLQSRLLKNENSAKLSVHDLLQRNESGIFSWKANLQAMAPFWETWFRGLSDNFVSCGHDHENKIAKLLILSDNETLDRGLIIGQMQGKYQLVVFNNSVEAGHFLQEDVPEKLGITLMDFLRRNNPEKLRLKENALTPLWGGKIHE